MEQHQQDGWQQQYLQMNQLFLLYSACHQKTTCFRSSSDSLKAMLGNLGSGGSSSSSSDERETGSRGAPPAVACSIDERWNEQGLAAAAGVTCMCATEGFVVQGDRRVEEGREGMEGAIRWGGGGGEAQPPVEWGWSGEMRSELGTPVAAVSEGAVERIKERSELGGNAGSGGGGRNRRHAAARDACVPGDSPVDGAPLPGGGGGGRRRRISRGGGVLTGPLRLGAGLGLGRRCRPPPLPGRGQDGVRGDRGRGGRRRRRRRRLRRRLLLLRSLHVHGGLRPVPSLSSMNGVLVVVQGEETRAAVNLSGGDARRDEDGATGDRKSVV